MLPIGRPQSIMTGNSNFVPDAVLVSHGARHAALGGAKRALDVAVSIALLILLAPVLLLVAILVLVTMGYPIFFTQTRPGLSERPFKLIKFRSMTNHRGSDGLPLPDNQRLGGFGRILRSTSLDELPELLNVLRGDMSLVGPRPLLMEYLPLYSTDQRRRHEVRPGLTGLAQIGGRNALAWNEKFALDLRYVDDWSLALDLKILAKTLWLVLTGHGVSHENHVTAPKFEGNRDQQ